MKKKMVALMAAAMVGTLAFGGSAMAEEAESYKIGFSFYNLSNPVWAELVEEAVTYGKELGCEVTYVDCGKDAQKQISQIENFIMSDCDAVVILPIDATAVEGVVQEALDEGIRVVSYSTDFKGAETNLALDPDATGRALVEMAKPYLEEKYPDGKFTWVFENIPSIELGVLEGNAVEAAMLEMFPDSELLGSQEVLANEEGVSVTENFMQAYPDNRVILGISAGVGVGGNEAIKTAVSEEEWADYLLFSVDATEQECANIANGEPLNGSIGLGGGKEHARLLVDCAISLLHGEELERYTPLPPTAVTPDTVADYMSKTYGK